MTHCIIQQARALKTDRERAQGKLGPRKTGSKNDKISRRPDLKNDKTPTKKPLVGKRPRTVGSADELSHDRRALGVALRQEASVT
jgi:hypothetical protein